MDYLWIMMMIFLNVVDCYDVLLVYPIIFPSFSHHIMMYYKWIIYGLYMDYLWIIYGLYMDYYWIIYGLFMDYILIIWIIYGL